MDIVRVGDIFTGGIFNHWSVDLVGVGEKEKDFKGGSQVSIIVTTVVLP